MEGFMSSYDQLQMLYKKRPTPKGEIRDRWALAGWLANTYGNHTQKEYASALREKSYSTEWNPESAKSKAKKVKEKGSATKEEEPKKTRKPRRKSAGRQMKLPGFRDRDMATSKKSLDDVVNLLNLMKEDAKIKEDDKDEHEDKEPIRDPFAVASWRAEREGHDLSTEEGKDRRKEIVDDIKEEGNIEKAEALQKISPQLAGRMAAAAGWALSDDIVEAGGGSPRGNMTPHQLREWERTVRRSMRKKDVSLDKASWDKLQKNYYDDSDLYFRKVPLQNAVTISKDHAPVPPRQGLQWDELKKKWVAPEHLGRSASELQGKKRVRGAGTGVHEHALHTGGAGGKGEGSGVAGRRFRSVGDSGVQSPHESKHAAGYQRAYKHVQSKRPRHIIPQK